MLSMVTEESLLSTISQVIGRREDEATLISSISGIDVFSPFVEPYDSDNNVYRVRLCDYNDFDLNNMAKILFEQSCEAAGIKIHSKVRFTTDMTIYRVTIDNLEQLNAMGEFESVYSAEKTYPIMATMDILDSDNVVVVKQPEETEEYPVVGVLDTGIADIPYLAPWKEAVVHENYPKEYQDNSHGSFVAGIIEYGDELNGTNISALSGVRLFNAVVHPGNAIDLADMTPSNRDKWLPSTRKWYLKIEGLYRDFIEKEAVKKDFQLSQEYCMILTIRDPEHTAPVYDEVTQQLTNRNFIHHDVRVRNVVHVTNE